MVCGSALWKVLALLTTDQKVGGSNPSGRATALPSLRAFFAPAHSAIAAFGQQLPVEKHRIVEVLRAHVDHQNRDRRRCGIDTVVGHI
jgi:hypothetical protein